MNYDKLKDLITLKGFSIQKACVAIGRTEGWFHSAVKKDTMTIGDLEKLLKLCKTNLPEFFCGIASNQTSDPTTNEIELLKENNELLRENRQLRKRIEELDTKKKPETVKPKAI